MPLSTYRELETRWKAMRGTRGVAIREVACVNAPRTLLCIEVGSGAIPRIALAAAIHGDEPAGALALLQLVDERALNPSYAYRIWPCTNPTGFDAAKRESIDGADLNRTFSRGGQSPEARAIIIANRDLKFALSIDLHEDGDADGFYCYEYGGGNLGLRAVAAVEDAGFPIESLATLDLGNPLLERSIHRERGRITADPFQEASAIDGLSYSLLVARNAARHTLTLETPTRDTIERRIAMHRLAVGAAIEALSAA